MLLVNAVAARQALHDARHASRSAAVARVFARRDPAFPESPALGTASDAASASDTGGQLNSPIAARTACVKPGSCVGAQFSSTSRSVTSERVAVRDVAQDEARSASAAATRGRARP